MLSVRLNVYPCTFQSERRRFAEEKVEGLQCALTQFQLVAEKRQTVEQQMRQSLEEEIRTIKSQKVKQCILE